MQSNRLRGARLFSALLTLLALSLNGCGARERRAPVPGAQSIEDARALVGLYKATGATLESAKIEYFLVTADFSVYTLQRQQVQYVRSHKGNILEVQFVFNEGNLASGQIVGFQIPPEEWRSLPEQIRLLAEVNRSATDLIGVLNPQGIEVRLRLEQEVPAFSERQVELLRSFVHEPAPLLAMLEKEKAKAVWINDFENPRLYLLGDRVCVPARLEAEAHEIISSIKTATIQLDRPKTP